MDLIIPVYNSTTLDSTLASIACQTDKKVKVYIIDDCSTIDYKETINFYKKFLNITYYRMNRNLGPGRARQVGIDMSNSSYIMFMDSDDCFISPYALETLKCYISDEYDVIISNFIEEDNKRFIDHKRDEIWLHGKVYSRKFLDKYRIHFNETRENEDNFFNQLIFLHNPNIFYAEAYTYMYRNNTDSITRRNNHEYQYRGNASYAYNISEAMREARLDGCDNRLISYLGYRALLSVYYLLNKWKDRDMTDLIYNAKRIGRFSDFNSVPKEYRNHYKEYFFDWIKENDNEVYKSMYLSLNDFWNMMGVYDD